MNETKRKRTAGTGNVTERTPGSWQLTYDGPRGTDGRRNQVRVTIKGSKAHAEKELRRLLREVDTGTHAGPSKETVGAFLERYLADCARTFAAASTLTRYEQIVRTQLVPALGKHRLTELKPLHIQAAHSAALENGRCDGKGGLSSQTVAHHHSLLRRALEQAVKWQMLAVNPADAVQAPRPRQHEMVAFTDEQVSQIIAETKGKPIHLPIIVALTTGLRRGEVVGLRWQDVDLDAASLAVRHSLEETEKGLAFKQPKTIKGRRVISLLSLTVDELWRCKGEQAQNKLTMGPGYKDAGLVVAMPDGSMMRPRYITLAFHRLAVKLKLPSTRFHDLRHTHASQLLREHIHPKVVSERLGHSTVGITLDRYSHLLPGLQEEAARKLDVALRAVIGG